MWKGQPIVVGFAYPDPDFLMQAMHILLMYICLGETDRNTDQAMSQV